MTLGSHVILNSVGAWTWELLPPSHTQSVESLLSANQNLSTLPSYLYLLCWCLPQVSQIFRIRVNSWNFWPHDNVTAKFLKGFRGTKPQKNRKNHECLRNTKNTIFGQESPLFANLFKWEKCTRESFFSLIYVFSILYLPLLQHGTELEGPLVWLSMACALNALFLTSDLSWPPSYLFQHFSMTYSFCPTLLPPSDGLPVIWWVSWKKNAPTSSLVTLHGHVNEKVLERARAHNLFVYNQERFLTYT